jgi:hypothetical protein
MSQSSLFGDSTLLPEDFPRSGMMRSGSLYALPTLERLIDGIGSSSSLGWPTPMAYSGERPGLTKLDIRARGLYPEDSRYWPTPMQRDDKGPSGRAMRGEAVGDLNAAVLWPTPLSRDWKGPGGSPNMTGGPDLPTMVARPSDGAKPSCPADERQLSLTGEAADQFRSAVLASNLWPTPDANVFNDGQSLEAYEARKVKEKEKAYNGNGGGTPLAMAVRLFPTPTAGDAKASGSRIGNPETRAHPGVTLTDVTARAVGKGALLNPDWVEALCGLPVGWTAGPPAPTSRKPPGSRPARSRAKKPRKPPAPDAEG